MRSTAEPNLRVQDGIKKNWLCAECEGRFSKDERAFASLLFYPYLDDSSKTRTYGPWLLRFCASVSWRLLRLALEQDKFESDWKPEDVQRCQEAELVWREFLLGKLPHPGDFRQHLLPLDIIKSGSGDAAPNINRFLARAIQIDLCQGNTTIFTFAKLGRFAIFGMVRPDKHLWRGTAVQANEGLVGPRDYVLPGPLWAYINDRARKAAAAMGSISEKQQARMDEAFRKNIDAFAGSDAFRAMEADVEMFGDAAFTRGAAKRQR